MVRTRLCFQGIGAGAGCLPNRRCRLQACIHPAAAAAACPTSAGYYRAAVTAVGYTPARADTGASKAGYGVPRCPAMLRWWRCSTTALEPLLKTAPALMELHPRSPPCRLPARKACHARPGWRRHPAVRVFPVPHHWRPRHWLHLQARAGQRRCRCDRAGHRHQRRRHLQVHHPQLCADRGPVWPVQNCAGEWQGLYGRQGAQPCIRRQGLLTRPAPRGPVPHSKADTMPVSDSSARAPAVRARLAFPAGGAERAGRLPGV